MRLAVVPIPSTRPDGSLFDSRNLRALLDPFSERGSRLDDTIGACRALWGSTPASFSSPSIQFEDLICVPRPEHAEDIPIWFGAALTLRMVRRVVQYGTGWMPFVGPEPRPMEMIARGVAALRQAMQQAGRDASTLEVSALLLPRGRDLATAIAQDIPAFQSAGVTHLRVQASMFVAALDALPRFLEDLLRHLEPYR